MSTVFPLTFSVREMTEDDIAACMGLDVSYETNYAWQMDVRDDEGAIVVGLRTIRLPRQMRVNYLREQQSFDYPPTKHTALLVAEAEDQVCGYLAMRFDAVHSYGWVTDLAVGRQWRRRGIGSRLLEEAYQYTQGRRLHRILVETQSKNYPGICFLQKHGMVFCGFNDRYYPNYDIALFFGRTIQHE